MKFKNKPKLTSKGIPYNYFIRKCLCCNNEYKPMTNVQKYCSLNCQNRIKRIRHKEQIYAYNKMYENKYPERCKLWRNKSANRPEAIEKRNKWTRAYIKKDYVRKKINQRSRIMMQNNLSKRIERSIRCRLYKKMKTYMKYGKNFPAKSERGLQINLIIKNLMLNIPSDFKEKKYVIDHIKPLCSFDLSNKEHFNQAFAIENHRWITERDNQNKAKEDRRYSLKILRK